MQNFFLISLGLSFLFFSQNLLAAEFGTFMVVKGSVKIESRGTTADAKVNSKVQAGDTIISGSESRAKIVMSDRNILNISPNTKMKIEKYTNSPGDKNVNLNLLEGKVRSKVEQKYDNKNSKFEVRTATAVAGVRGTEFVTSYNAATKVTEVITLKGQVSFQTISATGSAPLSEPVVIEKGEKSQTKENEVPAPPTKVPEKEMKQIDSDTEVKKKPKDPGTAKNPPPAGGVANRGDGTAILPPPAPLTDMPAGNTQIIDGAATRRFEKSKVKIITQPSN